MIASELRFNQLKTLKYLRNESNIKIISIEFMCKMWNESVKLQIFHHVSANDVRRCWCLRPYYSVLHKGFLVPRENFTASPDNPEAQRWNSSSIDFAEITMDRNFALLLVSLISAILWVVYITYYNSRVLGYILTRLINKFYFQDDNFKIGMFFSYFL